MQRLEVSGAVRPIYGSLGVKRLIHKVQIRNFAGIFQYFQNKERVETGNDVPHFVSLLHNSH